MQAMQDAPKSSHPPRLEMLVSYTGKNREEQCREALAAKEAALTTAEEELEQRKDSVQQAAAGFDDSLSRLADDERNYRVQEERLQFKQEEQQRREAECAASAESASRAADSCRELV